ncbi:MAG: T9SS type A sorting domain-containing protein [Bacteroidota bacterium]
MKNKLNFLILFLLASAQLTWAQVTPAGANTDAECGEDCWDLFSWTAFTDNDGNVVGGEGLAADANCNTTIDAFVEYTGADATPDFSGTTIGANSQGTSTDSWALSFGTPLTSPVISFSALETGSEVLITDCEGNEIMATCITSCGTNLAFTSGIGWTGDVAYSLQLSGTYDCININVAVTDNDAYNFSAGTCLGAAPFPPCVNCADNENFRYISLTNKEGSGTGATANIELNNVLVGSAEVLFSDLDVNEDLAGTTFGGFDNDGGTYLLKLSFCEPIAVQQLDIINLEVESEVSIGTTITGSGAMATLGGLALSQCAGSNRMSLNDGAPNLVITDGPGCGANPNASYTFDDAMVDCLYFKYQNPVGGCSFDYVGFKIGTCVSDGADAVPVCPLTYVTYATDIEDYVTNGPDFNGNDANAFQVMRDANGNFFDQNCQQIENDVNNMNAIPTVTISPCAEVVEEEDCSFCTPTPPCNDCPTGSEYTLINLRNGSDTDGDGLDEGQIYIDGVCIGDFDVVFSDLDVNEDVSGTQFGGFDNDGGVYVLRLDFCDPMSINQLDIRNLEVESQVSVGTTIMGTPAAGMPTTLSGLTLTQCAGSPRMAVNDGLPNLVIADGPGCGANPNGSYTLGGASVSTLYFQYYNPAGGCSYDYVGFKLGTCYIPSPMEIPVCPLEVVRVSCDMNDVIANGISNNNTDEYVVDGNGNYFDYQNCTNTILRNALTDGTPLQTVDIGCAELVETVEECVIEDCVITPTCAATACPADTEFDYINLDQSGTNAEGLPTGTVELNGTKIGTYDFLFSDLDVSNDGNGTTFGGWDNDGGTMLLQLNFCSPIEVQELDVINLEVASEIQVGTAISGNGAAAVLTGQTLTVCNDPSGRMGVGPAPNQVITDGPGCGANPNATYTVSSNPVSTLFFKYQNPTGGCRGDYVGFKIGVCTTSLPEAVPTCPLALYTIDDCPGDASSNTFNAILDANGNWFAASNCPNTIPTDLEQTIEISPCASQTFVEDCTVCCMLEVMCPPTDLGTISCNDAIPAPATDEASFEALGGLIADDPGFCGTLMISSSDEFAPATDICNGRTLTRTYTISDDKTTIMCVQTLSITAPNAPMITCPADQNLECTDDTSVAANGMATATADCGLAANISLSEMSTQIMDGSCSQYQYTISRVWTATDDCGRTDVCTQIINVEDSTPPVAPPAPAPLVLECANEIPNIFTLTATDNCAPDITVFPIDAVTIGNCPSRLSIVRTWTFVDPCGNTSSISQSIEVLDDQPIQVTCPPTRSIECFSDIMPENNLLMVDMPCNSGFTVEASEPFLSSGAPNCPGTVYTIVYTVSDPCGRSATCQQNFIVDNDPPEFVCPAEICYVECDTPAEVLEGHFDAFVNTAIVNTSCPMSIKISHDFNPASMSAACGASQVVTFTATDDCGRSATCTVLVVVQDNNPPVIDGLVKPGKYECDDKLQINFNNWVQTNIAALNASDNCGEVTWNVNPQTPTSYCQEPFAVTDVTFTATDECGNSAAVVGQFFVANRYGVSILGNLSDDEITCDQTPEFGVPAISNTCGDFTLDHEDVTIPTECGYTITRTWTAIDGCGKVSTRSQTITVVDNQGPVFTNVPLGGSILCDAYPPQFGPVEVEDDCGEVTLTHEDVFIGDPNGCITGSDFEVTRVWTATDNCGNSSTASQSFGVRASQTIRGGKKNNIVIAPNPTTGIIRLSIDSDHSEQVTLQVYNILGQMMINDTWTSVRGVNDRILDLSQLDSATYLIVIQAGEDVSTQKVVKVGAN